MPKQEIITGILISIAFVSLVVFFCLLLIKLYIQKIKEHNKKEIAFQETIKTTIIETQEQVLKNISQDLHDDAGQQLTSLNLQLENLKLDSPELHEALEPVSKSLGLLSLSIKNITHSLNHNIILKTNFVKVIDTEVKRLKRIKRITVDYTFDEIEMKNFSENERLFIYRIFQECINNCLKHSKCSRILIVMRTTPQFEMIFSDNGKGFDPNIDFETLSLGLSGMKERANKINYSLLIDSTPGKGTRIVLSETKSS